jgi:hypothetical protein
VSGPALVRLLQLDDLQRHAAVKNRDQIARIRTDAIGTLEAISGKQYGDDVARWKTWLAEHHPDS